MDNDDIEKKARELQLQIWEERKQLFPEKEPALVSMLDPEVAAKVLGIDFDKYEELGRFGDGQTRFEVAGMIDRQGRRIAVSRRFPLETVRFTGAHEIGHWLLHDDDEIMHRDRPIKGLESGKSRPKREKEADHFAACFLMPAKPLKNAFESIYGRAPLLFDDNVAFRLCPSDPDSLLRPCDAAMNRALAAASAEHYGGRHFNSLAKQFCVSSTSMAIRIRELGLIRE